MRLRLQPGVYKKIARPFLHSNKIMYSVSDYGEMIADRVRLEAYRRALRQHVNSNSVVLDVGTGTGIFAFLACELGARRVYAIEPNDAIQVARQIAATSDFAHRIEFIQGLSTKISLPEKADVIVSDLRGKLPVCGHHFSTIIDVRERFLAPGGVLIPQQDTLWVAIVSAPEMYEPYVKPWDEYPLGLDARAARRITLNNWNPGRALPEQLLVAPQKWQQIDYRIIESVNVAGDLIWNVERAGVAHGLCVWFDALLADDIGFSNAPGGGAKVYGSAFFPWLEPVALEWEDQISVRLEADWVGDDYVWNWNTLIRGRGASADVKADFRQSTFLGLLLSPERLHKQTDNYVPCLNEDGLITQFILSLMGDEKTQGEIARQLLAQYPHRFANWQAALTQVAKISGQYCE